MQIRTQRANLTDDAITTARTERNRITAQFKKCASNASSVQWNKLCDKANLNTTQFWAFHNSLDRRCSAHHTVMYDDSNNMLQSCEDQGRAFLQRFISQSDHNDIESREELVKQLDDLADVAAPDTDLSTDEVTRAIKTTKNGAPGPDAITIETFKGLSEHNMADLTCAFNDSWKSGVIPEKWTDSYISPVSNLARTIAS